MGDGENSMSTTLLITAPTIEPVTVAKAKAQARILQSAEDDLLTRMVAAARGQVESTECWIQLVAATYELRLDKFPDCNEPIILPKPPLLEVLSITYIDPAGDEQTFGSGSPITEYVVDLNWTPGQTLNEIPENGRIRLAYGETWPVTRCEPNAVRVRFRCGFGEATQEGSPAVDVPPSIPESIEQWIVIAAGTMFEHREAEIAIGRGEQITSLQFVRGLLDPWRAKPL